MKAILMSIQPKWCEKIANGEKTIEVRKTKPKLQTPFKCYIYCTYGQGLIEFNDEILPNHLIEYKVSKDKIWGNCCNGKVIGEFVCDRIDNKHLDDLIIKEDCEQALKGTCLTKQEILNYLSYTRGTDIRQNYKMWLFYGWNIRDLKIYDKPKELSEFKKAEYNYGHIHLPPSDISRPPQSWCYVEERGE